MSSAAILFQGSAEALSFEKPEVLTNAQGNTYALRGKTEKVPLVRVFGEMLAGIDVEKYRKPQPETA
jgi:hypothetical protein